MIGLLGGLLLTATPSITIGEAGIAGRLTRGAIPVRVDVAFGDLAPAAGSIEVAYRGTDGDIVRRSRPVSVMPGTTTSQWILVAVPDPDVPLVPSLLDDTSRILIQGTPTAASALATPLGPEQELQIVIGSDRGGLGQLEAFNDDQLTTAPVATVAIRASSLPDIPGALAGVDTIIWSDGGVPDDRVAVALLDAVVSGGHLVLLPPALGAPWGDGAGLVTRAVGFDRPPEALTVSPMALAGLMDEGALGNDLVVPALPAGGDWSTILNTRSGRRLVVRQPMGFGQITISAIDPSRRALNALRTPRGTPAMADLAMFWGPVLGRRDLPSVSAFDRADRERRLRSPERSFPSMIGDDLPSKSLSRTTAVSGRLLLAATIAGVYLLIAGPVIGRTLRRPGLRAWVWPAFMAAAVAFAALTWGLGSWVMPTSTDLAHVTVLDHVSGTPRHRVQSWIDMQLPGAGMRMLDVNNNQTDTALLRPWKPSQAATIAFGDVRRLPPVDDPAQVRTAARDATTKLHLQWTGLADPERWGRLLSADPNDPVRIEGDKLHGTLVNRLDVPLDHVSLIWIQNRVDVPGGGGTWLDPAMAGRPLVRGQWWALKDGRLPPGGEIDLDLIEPSPESNLLRIVSDLQQSLATRASVLGERARRLRQSMELLSLWSLTTPRPWAIPPPSRSEETPTARRERETPPEWNLPPRHFGHDLDLGPWLASPALIVLAWIDASELPLDLRINGEPADTEHGKILIRWILPLPGTSHPDSEAA